MYWIWIFWVYQLPDFRGVSHPSYDHYHDPHFNHHIDQWWSASCFHGHPKSVEIKKELRNDKTICWKIEQRETNVWKKVDNVHAREIDLRPPLYHCTSVSTSTDRSTCARRWYQCTRLHWYSVPGNTTSVWSRKGDQTSSSISRSTHHCTQGKPDQ